MMRLRLVMMVITDTPSTRHLKSKKELQNRDKLVNKRENLTSRVQQKLRRKDLFEVIRRTLKM